MDLTLLDVPASALLTPLLAPLAAAALALLLPWRAAAWAGVLAAMLTLATGLAVAAHPPPGYGLLRADALSAWMLIVIGAVATIACWAGIAQLRGDLAVRRYLVLTQLFLSCMSLAVLADNLGLMWVAVEATTIVTAFLVGHRRTRASVEAAWKYVVLCSLGIAIAFLGTVCVYAASVAAGAHGFSALDWTYLNSHPAGLNADLMRLAAGLVLLGFGTKAGLAPMHAWLPDAHSQAPAPVSALMSGVLLSVAFYALLRYRTIIDAVIGPGYLRALLLIAGLCSLAVAAALLIAQRDYKRMLAYSSIEHMGLIALGAAFGGPLATAAALLHILGHGLAKAVAFCSTGRVLHLTGSTAIADGHALAAREPATAAALGIGLVALLGLPPFSLFASELGIARSGFAAGHGWAVVLAFALVLVAFAAIGRHAATMLLGESPVAHARAWRGMAPLALGLLAAAALGVSLGPLRPLLAQAAAVASGGGQ